MLNCSGSISRKEDRAMQSKWWALVLSAGMFGTALAQTPTVAACEAEHSTVLQAAAPLPKEFLSARAAWLDERHLRWAGVPQDGRYWLLHAPSPTITLAAGAPARGAQNAVRLEPTQPLPPSPALQRFSHISAGATLRVPADVVSDLRAWHRGQLMLVRTDAQDRVLQATRVQAAGALDALYASAERTTDLGVTVSARRTAFALWAPTAQRVWLCLYPDARTKAQQVLALRADASGVWRGALPGDRSGRYYRYVVDVQVPSTGRVRNWVTDPYSVSLSADSQRSYIADLNSATLKPAGWDAQPLPTRVAHATDMVIYELHVRDFSAQDSSVREAWRGKYLAFTEPQSRGVQHLRALSEAGLTDVHLLPVFDLATVPERGCATPKVPQGAPDSDVQQTTVMAAARGDCYNWGYDPWHFNAPEGSFATEADDGAVRIRELRSMILALHRMNLRVGMDVVYNHTTASGQNAKSVLDRIVPGYYQRLNGEGQVEMSTCCDNTATEHRMMAKLMIDSAVLWARHHKIDSFRFDLMGHQPREAMERLQRAVNQVTGRRIDLIGEGWNFGEVADGKRFVQASQKSLNGSGIGTFSDRGRDAARGGGQFGSPDDYVREQGWLNGLHFDPNELGGAATKQQLMHAADVLRAGLAGTQQNYELHTSRGEKLPLSQLDYNGQGAGYASQPSEVVNYVENHDNQTLFDANVQKLPKGTSREDRARVQTLGAALVAFSQGVAYFHAGQEVLRSKNLDRNSYDSGDWFNRLDLSYQSNFFGTGLPPAQDNRAHWPLMQPLLAQAQAIAPTPAEIRFTRDAFLDLLRIRASSSLFRLRSAEDVQKRLRFHNTGPSQEPTLIVGELDGQGLVGANFRRIVYLLNADKKVRSASVPALAGQSLDLHPVHQASTAADHVAAQATFSSAQGQFTVPARTAVVFVQR
jgi:pullulanase